MPPLDAAIRERVAPLLTPLGSSINPIDLTPGVMTNPKHRASLPEALAVLADAPDVDMPLSRGGIRPLAPALVTMFDDRAAPHGQADLPELAVAAGGHRARASPRTASGVRRARPCDPRAGHIVRHAADLRHRIRHRPDLERAFPWDEFVAPAGAARSSPRTSWRAFSKPPAFRSRADGWRRPPPRPYGRRARSAFPWRSRQSRRDHASRRRGTRRAGRRLAGGGRQDRPRIPRARRRARRHARRHLDPAHVRRAGVELLVTAFRDREFGVIVGCGLGGGMTEIIDDVVFARAPIDADGAFDLLRPPEDAAPSA